MTLAGNGGSGGVELSSTADAIGGKGGNALGSGNGAAGGSANSTAIVNGARKLSLRANATGGAGGDGSGAGHRGGEAGSAMTTLQGDAGAADVVAVLNVTGGAGGNGNNGAAGAHGADVILHNVASVATTGKLSIAWGAVGGAGGASAGGRAGAGGNGEGSLVLDEQRAADVSARVYSRGGSGGAASNGVTGAGGTARSRADVVSKAALTLLAEARGGTGGTGTGVAGASGGSARADATGRSLTGTATVDALATGGIGGDASAPGTRGGNGGTATAVAVSHSANGTASATALAVGGSGGNGTAGAAGGTGGAATLINAATGSTGGTLQLRQRATGGRGGNAAGALTGAGGIATSRLTLTDTAARSINAAVEAIGGDSGTASGNGAIAGSGGAAEAVLDLTAKAAGSSASARVLANSGWLNGRSNVANAAGDAIARSTVQADLSASNWVQATGGSDRIFVDGPYPKGGNADVSGRAVSNGQASTDASAFTYNPGTKAVVRAEAIGGNGTTLASAHAQTFVAQVSAYSSATGAASNSARASAFADSGTLQAQSVSTGSGGTLVQTQGTTSVLNYYNKVMTSANVGGVFAPMTLDTWDNLSHATALPDAVTATAAFSASPHVAAMLADSHVIGIGTITGAFSPPPGQAFGTPQYTVLSANFQFMNDTPGFLVLGLLGWDALDTGFGQLDLAISNHGEALFTHTFSNVADARDFFSDQAFNLGVLAAGNQDLLLTAGFSSDEIGRFGFQYAFGISPVPEPQTWLLMLLGSTVLFLRRRRAG